MSSLREWLRWHSIRAHIFAPLWLRISEKRRWAIVDRLNRSPRFCWADLVSAAMAHRESDPCDTYLPNRERAGRCASTCDYSHEAHSGEHPCSCYCGKFRFLASEGAIDRIARTEATR